ncbi:MAG: competence/damage-inducible protein A [Candidatus Latescibacteria bacterium 4484_107]|nr:MAG: competence/damage-inducible protein A [Candidatus Latescibacteria bacterium 4484_107]
MNAEVITIGNEILSGRIVDSNSAFIGARLSGIGIPLAWITSVGDDRDRIAQAFEQAMARADVVLVTGGLGPTHDDMTKHVFAELFGRKLVLNEEVLERVRERFAHRGIEMPSSNVDQAMVPEGVEALENQWGTAPGLHLEEAGKHVFLLPGVPREMKGLLEQCVLPILERAGFGRPILQHTLRTTGISESALYERLRNLPDMACLAFLPGLTGVDLHITVQGDEETAVRGQIETMAAEIRERVGEFLYGEGDQTIEAVVGEMLMAKSWRMAVAESCTGGLIASRITDVPGSSNYFERGIVAYSNRAKVALLGVPEDLIAAQGAVSAPVAEAMAEGVRVRSNVDISLSVTGIAGPAGGTEEKPVGLVFMGVSTAEKTFSKKFQFGNERWVNKQRTAQAGLDLVRRALVEPAAQGGGI